MCVPMSDDACPLPTTPTQDEPSTIARMLRSRRITIVGASDDPSRASFAIASYLLGQGYEVVPVNPNHRNVLGLTCYPSLDAVPGNVEVVNVFRRPEYCAAVAREAIARGATGLWLQSGISSPEARRIATERGVDYIENRCIMVEHMRL
jgi:predicted CoA-binding protein